MSVVTALPTVEKQRDGVEGITNVDEEEALDVNDDFKREMHL